MSYLSSTLFPRLFTECRPSLRRRRGGPGPLRGRRMGRSGSRECVATLGVGGGRRGFRTPELFETKVGGPFCADVGAPLGGRAPAATAPSPTLHPGVVRGGCLRPRACPPGHPPGIMPAFSSPPPRAGDRGCLPLASSLKQLGWGEVPHRVGRGDLPRCPPGRQPGGGGELREIPGGKSGGKARRSLFRPPARPPLFFFPAAGLAWEETPR